MRRRQFFIAIAAATFAGTAGGGMSDALLRFVRMRFVSAPGGPGQPWKRERIYAGDWA